MFLQFPLFYSYMNATLYMFITLFVYLPLSRSFARSRSTPLRLTNLLMDEIPLTNIKQLAT